MEKFLNNQLNLSQLFTGFSPNGVMEEKHKEGTRAKFQFASYLCLCDPDHINNKQIIVIMWATQPATLGKQTLSLTFVLDL